jgi:hypothetical protein
LIRFHSDSLRAVLVAAAFSLLLVGVVGRLWGAIQVENFDVDPGWSGNSNTGYGNNNFGYSNTSFAGGAPGEAGGAVSTRTDKITWYADTDLGGSLSLQESLMASGRFTVQSIAPGVTGALDIGFFASTSATKSAHGGIEEALVFSILEHSLSTYRVRVRLGNKTTGSSNTYVLNAGTDYLFNLLYGPNAGGIGLGRLDVEFRRAADNAHLVTLSEVNASTLNYNLNSFGITTNDFDRIEPPVNVFIDDLTYTTATVIPGDFNRNNVVDAADYPLWRRLIGELVPACSGPDANCNGAVDNDDYRVWRSNFGRTHSAGASDLSALAQIQPAVPEPAALALLLWGTLAAFTFRRLR